jgi:hypothetical protein
MVTFEPVPGAVDPALFPAPDELLPVAINRDVAGDVAEVTGWPAAANPATTVPADVAMTTDGTPEDPVAVTGVPQPVT